MKPERNPIARDDSRSGEARGREAEEAQEAEDAEDAKDAEEAGKAAPRPRSGSTLWVEKQRGFEEKESVILRSTMH